MYQEINNNKNNVFCCNSVKRAAVHFYMYNYAFDVFVLNYTNNSVKITIIGDFLNAIDTIMAYFDYC